VTQICGRNTRNLKDKLLENMILRKHTVSKISILLHTSATYITLRIRRKDIEAYQQEKILTANWRISNKLQELW
jgi:hypothetical protein